MADPILRLRVESKDYDSKIKRATDGLLAFEDSCHKAQKSMADADKATVDFVRQMGKMETVNRTAKGSVGELTKSFVELSAQYNRLTEEEKRSPFGKALSKSIDELKGRIQQGRQELDSINRSLGETGKEGGKTGSILDSLAGKFGLNSAQLMKFGSTLGIATTALNVAKDAFFSNEQQLDEWNRVVLASKSVYQGFLDTLNTGDFSGFFSRINSIISAARDAYDALDALNTYNAFNQINVYKAKNAMGNAIADFREGKGGKDNIKQSTEAYIKELRGRQEFEKNAYNQAVTDLAKKRGVDPADLYKILTGEWGTYDELKSQKLTGRKIEWTGYKRAVPANEKERLGAALRRINDEAELDRIQKLGLMAEMTEEEINQTRKSTARVLNSRTGTTGRTGGGGRVSRGGGRVASVPKTEMQLNTETINQLNQEYISATDERRTAIRGEIKVLQDRNAEIQKLIDESNGKLPEQVMEGSVKALNQSMSELKKKQQDVTNSDDWQKLQTEIDGVQRKIDEIQGKTGPDMSLFSQENIQALISSVKQQMGSAQLGSELYANLANQMSDATALSNLITEFLKNGIDLASVDASAMWAKIFGGEDVATEELQKMLDVLNAYLAENGLDLMQLGGDGSLTSVSSKKGGNKFEEGLDKVSKGMSGLSTVMSGMQQIGLKIPTGIQEAMTVMQGLVSVVQGVSTVISLFSTTAETANTAALLANTAAVTANTVAMGVKAVVPFMATGGVVHAATGLVAGHDFSDNVPVMVSSGELILNKAQQGNLASQLEGNGGMNGLYLETSVRAEEFRIMLNSNSMRRGRGEYVTTKTMR